MAKVEELHGSGEFVCDCGRTFTHGAWYTKHKLHCDGTPATEGRIAARSKALVPVSVAKAAHKMSGRRPRRAHAEPTPPPAVQAVAAIAAAATDKAMEIVIAGLLAKRTAIDNAIAALQAVSA